MVALSDPPLRRDKLEWWGCAVRLFDSRAARVFFFFSSSIFRSGAEQSGGVPPWAAQHTTPALAVVRHVWRVVRALGVERARGGSLAALRLRWSARARLCAAACAACLCVCAHAQREFTIKTNQFVF